jgi:hypothetical protein
MKSNSEIKKKVTRVETLKCGERILCDCCGKVIFDENVKGNPHEDVPYWKVETGHYDYGDESYEDDQFLDICSPECLRKTMEEYIKNCSNYHRTYRFNVEQDFRFLSNAAKVDNFTEEELIEKFNHNDTRNNVISVEDYVDESQIEDPTDEEPTIINEAYLNDEQK